MVVNDYFYLHHLLGEWSKMLLTTIHYEGEILRLPSARLLIAYIESGKTDEILYLFLKYNFFFTELSL